jgi:hypothetical protein
MLNSRVTVTAALTTVVMVSLGVGAFAAENWTRFRGPNGTGVSTATNLPIEFGPQSHVK